MNNLVLDEQDNLSFRELNLRLIKMAKTTFWNHKGDKRLVSLYNYYVQQVRTKKYADLLHSVAK